jgi:hypothetical protein
MMKQSDNLLDDADWTEMTFEEDSLKHHGVILTGRFAHNCPDWDYMPLDETLGEFAYCSCYLDNEAARYEQSERRAEIEMAGEWEDEDF